MSVAIFMATISGFLVKTEVVSISIEGDKQVFLVMVHFAMAYISCCTRGDKQYSLL